MPSSLNTTGKLIAAFVTLLVGVILISSLATEGLDKTSTVKATDETVALLNTLPGFINTSNTYTLTNAPTGWKINDCPLTSVVITNTTGGNTLTVTTDYTLTASAGTIVFKNTTATVGLIGPNSTLVDYYYCPDDYMNLTWGRTIINLVPGFFALAILGASLLLFYSVAKDYDII